MNPDEMKTIRMLHAMQNCLYDLEITLELFNESQEENNNIKIPKIKSRRKPFIFSHYFLYSADTFSKLLNIFCHENHLNDILKNFNNKFPMLSDIRNSAQHLEDRIRGYKKNSKKINLKPINNGYIECENSVILSLGNLFGNKLSYTTANGDNEEFEISQRTLTEFVKILNTIKNSISLSVPFSFL